MTPILRDYLIMERQRLAGMRKQLEWFSVPTNRISSNYVDITQQRRDRLVEFIGECEVSLQELDPQGLTAE